MSIIFLSFLVFGLSFSEAFNLPHHPHIKGRQITNSTSSLLSGTANKLVTSTVFTTSISTILGCATSVLHCPAEQATHINLVNVTIPAFTTICSASSGTVPMPTGTGVLKFITEIVSPIPPSTAPGVGHGDPATAASMTTAPAAAELNGTTAALSAAAQAHYSTSLAVSQGTFIYTMGIGSSATVITTTIDITSTITLYHVSFDLFFKLSSTSIFSSSSLLSPHELMTFVPLFLSSSAASSSFPVYQKYMIQEAS